MPRSYPPEFRRRVLDLLAAGRSVTDAADASIDDVDDADMDIASTVSALNGLMRADEGELAEALRPMYIDYVLEHL